MRFCHLSENFMSKKNIYRGGTMKVVVFTIVLLILFFVGSLLFSQYVNNSCQSLLKPIDALTDAITAENWDKTETTYKELRNIWEENERIWAYLLDHYDSDRVSLTLDKLQQYLLVQDRNLALSEVTELKFTINLIANKESFSLDNLF